MRIFDLCVKKPPKNAPKWKHRKFIKISKCGKKSLRKVEKLRISETFSKYRKRFGEAMTTSGRRKKTFLDLVVQASKDATFDGNVFIVPFDDIITSLCLRSNGKLAPRPVHSPSVLPKGPPH